MSRNRPLADNLTSAAIELAERNTALAKAERDLKYAQKRVRSLREHAAEAEMMLAEMVSQLIPELRHTAGDKIAERRLQVLLDASHHLAGGRSSEAQSIITRYLEARPRHHRAPALLEAVEERCPPAR